MTGSASERSAEGSEESGDGEEASQTASSTDAPEETIETEASEDSTVVSDESSEEPESDVPTATRNTARSRADEVALAVDAQRRARRSQLVSGTGIPIGERLTFVIPIGGAAFGFAT